jgi:hypothetical protein
MTQNTKPLNLNATVTDVTAGARQGVEYISINRPATSALTSWDGNPDCALKIQAYNRAVNGTNGGTRGIDVTARNRDAGTESWIGAIYATAENSANTIVSASVGWFNMKNNGVISTSHYGVVIQDNSQGTGPTDTVLLKLTTGTIDPASGAVPKAMQIASANTAGFVTGLAFNGIITNAIGFNNTSGANGFTVGTFTNTVVDADPDAFIKIDGNGTPYYVPAYVTMPA